MPYVSKHRFFPFLDADILPDNALVNIALDDAYQLGVLSSRIHVTWTLAAGETLDSGEQRIHRQGRVRWLRPSYQAPEETQSALEMDAPAAGTGGAPAAEKLAWGGTSLAERTRAIQQIVAAAPAPLTPEAVAARFRHARRQTVGDILDTLAALGQAERTDSGAFAG